MVGVVSARHHRELRRALRDTWAERVREHPHIRDRHGCPVPEEDREDPYSCAPLNFTEPVAGQEVEIITGFDASVLTSSEVSVVSLQFKVLHPIVITRLGVFPSAPTYMFPGTVSVRLFPLGQEVPVVSAHFGPNSSGTEVNGVWYKAVELFILPRGFEGTLLWEGVDAADLTTINVSQVHLNGGGVLKISLIEEGVLPHRGARGFPGLAGMFTFSIHDAEGLTAMLRGRPERIKSHRATLDQEEVLLQQESRQHGDVVFVDVVDTYRNIPSKLLLFYKWYAPPGTSVHFRDQKHFNRRNFWWGNFRQNWPVDIAGKWQELDYTGSVYPAFACGSGYVVSRDVVEWLADNVEKLKVYQDSRWLCEQGCYVDMLSSPQHTAEELRSLWHKKKACGDPCGCPWGQP
ncbi:UDP-GalNAc:beta-1,3-N-acetylgalactosaminyltransferase 2-like [Scleropages formosus]|uniref:Hexosyltransferase n=1 Tax=Scleropages formosus TaxID=113540 RepID=A0A0P7UPB0_SCLFO|nr:UDP-GalNAc:beta-1,3-N-acetylgalactosaminyltransferase 2-like [Scleropages formosus]